MKQTTQRRVKGTGTNVLDIPWENCTLQSDSVWMADICSPPLPITTKAKPELI